jgi:electron-transferring-flavoprotein dehydrogenase
MAMQSGLVAADAVYQLLFSEQGGANEAVQYPESLKKTWMWNELYRVRNVRPSFRWGLWGGFAYSALDTALMGYAPWTLSHHEVHACMKTKDQAQKIDYPKPDGKLTFDRLSSVYLSNTNTKNQRCHLQLKDAAVAIDINYTVISPKPLLPGGRVRIVGEEMGVPRLQISANCVHCKTCDIKDRRRTSTVKYRKAVAGRTPGDVVGIAELGAHCPCGVEINKNNKRTKNWRAWRRLHQPGRGCHTAWNIS